MRTKTITTPAGEDLNELLATIEGTPDAFTYGRRNNDLVNWFLTKKMISIDNGGTHQWTSEYKKDFAELKTRLSKTQKDDLNEWIDGHNSKIDTLYDYYGKVTDPAKLINLWLPMEYSI